MSAGRQSVALVDEFRPSLSSSEIFDGAEDPRILSVLMAAIADLAQTAGRNVPMDAGALSDLVGLVVSRHFGTHLEAIASQPDMFGQYEQFSAKDSHARHEEKICAVWLALVVLDGEAARIAMSAGLRWNSGMLADHYCPNPPTVEQVLACRKLPLTDDLAKLYGLAQQVYGGLERHTRSTSSGRDIVPVSGDAKLSACFPSYIRDFNGVVSLPVSSAGRGAPVQLFDTPENGSAKTGVFRQSLLIATTIVLCLFAGFLLGWVYQGQMSAAARVSDSVQEPV